MRTPKPAPALRNADRECLQNLCTNLACAARVVLSTASLLRDTVPADACCMCSAERGRRVLASAALKIRVS